MNPKKSPQKSRSLWIGALVIVALSLLVAAYRLHLHPATPAKPSTATAPPLVDVSGLDPEVAGIINQCHALVLKSPASGRSWGILGSAYYAHDFRAEAHECFVRAEQLDPDEPRWPYLAALALFMSDADAGLVSLRRAVALTGASPSSPSLRLAELLIERGDVEEAEDLVRGVLEAEPTNSRAHLGLGRIHFARGEFEASFEQLKTAVEIAPAVRPSRVLLATVAQRLEKPDPTDPAAPAISELPDTPPWIDPFQQEALSLRRGRDANIETARQMLEDGRSKEAVPLLEKTTATYPDAEQAWWMLGVACQRENLLDSAEAAFRTAVEIAPESLDARTRFGLFLLFSRNDPDQAEHQLREALKLNPGRGTSIFNLALCDSKKGDLDAAIEGFRKSLQLMPAFLEAQLALAEALWRNGDEPAARAQLDRALELNPNDPRARDLRTHFNSNPSPPSR